jgi:hypothetical protein
MTAPAAHPSPPATDAAVFAALDQAIAQAPSEARPGMVVALAARLALLGAGMAAQTGQERGPVAVPNEEELLTPEQAIEAIGGHVSTKWLYRHTRGLKFRRDLSRKVVRFERAGLLRWMAAKKAA